jgi:hypothetical protein
MLLLMVMLLVAEPPPMPAPPTAQLPVIKPVIKYEKHCGWAPVITKDRKGEEVLEGLAWHCH